MGSVLNKHKSSDEIWRTALNISKNKKILLQFYKQTFTNRKTYGIIISRKIKRRCFCVGNVYLVIDLKTFFASVECAERGLDPFTTNLVVADPRRGNGSVCLAITPAMKNLGVRNRCRVYEIPKNLKYIMAVPRMSKYMEYSANIYGIYLKYISKDDIYPYSIDECFIDVTHYLKLYKMNAMELAKTMMKDILDTYKITATCGIGNNMYLAKIALDILSKHSPTNIAWLNEEKYIKTLGDHKPITDFWGVGKGTANRLKKMGIFTMNEVARCSEKRLYKEFGINARFLIDHSKGLETCTIADIKDYKPKTTSYSNSQILFKDYNYESARLIVKEMVELLSQKLIENNKKAGVIRLYIGYSKDVIKSTGGSRKLTNPSNLYTNLVFEFMQLFDQTTDKDTPIRKVRNKF